MMRGQRYWMAAAVALVLSCGDSDEVTLGSGDGSTIPDDSRTDRDSASDPTGRPDGGNVNDFGPSDSGEDTPSDNLPGGSGSDGAAAGSGGLGASGAGGQTGGVDAGGQPGDAGVGGESGGAGGGGPSGEQGAAGSGAASECAGHERADFAIVGWATQAGGTSGGKGGNTVRVSDGAALMTALKDKQDSSTPLTILVSGRITEANSGVNKIDVKDVRDVSILGEGAGAELDGIGIKITRASNIVLRNLRIHHVSIGDKDGISIEGPADHIWIDHCEIYSEFQGVDKDFYDGLLDAKAEAEYITYSWNYLHDSWKTALVGSSEGDTFDRKLTMHHNYLRNCNSRLPLFRGGNGHVFNNYYEDIADTGINARLGACLRVENNYFNNARNPWISAYSDTLGGAELICNATENGSVFEYSDEVQELPTCSATVPYDYAAVLNDTVVLPDLVPAHAGVGKLADPTQF